MAEFTDYLETELLDHAFGGAGGAWTAPTSLYLALLTSPAADSDTCATISEPSTGNYARQLITFDPASGTSPAVKSNTSAITFTNDAATTWNVVGVAIVDSETGTLSSNKVLCYDNDMADASVAQNEKLQFAAGGIDISLD